MNGVDGKSELSFRRRTSCQQSIQFQRQERCYSISISDRSIAMSSDYAFIANLVQIQNDFYRIGGPILVVLGMASSVLSLMIFTRKNLRKNPCSIYLVAVNVSNLLLIFTSILFSTLATGYNIDPSAYNLSFCRFRYFTMFLFDILSPSYLILASIDRILLTSSNALTRQRSTPRLAYTCIIVTTLCWSFLHIHTLILTNIVQLLPGVFLCFFQLGMHFTVVSYYSLIIKGILIPLLMLSLGLWAVKNVRNAACVMPVSVVPTLSTRTNRRTRADHLKDRQLLRILLVDIIVYIFFNAMLVIVLLYQQIKQNQMPTLVERQMQNVLANIAVFSTYIPFCIGCYTNLLASKTFRQEIKKILLCK